MKRIGVFVDGSNIKSCGGFGMDYHVLRELAIRDGSEPVRMNTYIAYDEERARTDFDYRVRNQGYHTAVRAAGFKVVIKPVKWFVDSDTGSRVPKSNADLDMAVDMLLQTRRLDQVLLCTGDGDMAKVVQALQDRGIRVSVLAFNNVSHDIRTMSDEYIDGFMIPNLLDPKKTDIPSHVTGDTFAVGRISSYSMDRRVGRISFLRDVPENLWDAGAYTEVFFAASAQTQAAQQMLESGRRHAVAFNYTIKPGQEQDPKNLPVATNLHFI